jgi:hypothetical protein
MTAAVQNIDSAAYLPPPPSTSMSDAKGTSAAGKPAMDAAAAKAQGAPSDFQSELELQQTGAQETQPAGPPKTGLTKSGSSKSGKKRNTPDGANLSAVTPVQATQPQKQILPLALALAPPQELAHPQELAQLQEPAQQQELAQLQENAKLDDDAKLNQKATPYQTPQQPGEQAGQASSQFVAAVAQPPGTQQPAVLKQSAKLQQSAQSLQALQIAASNALPATADPGKVPVLPFAPVLSVTQDIPVRQEGKKSEDPASPDQDITSAKPGASSNSQPVSLAGLKLTASPAEPVAAAAQVTADSAASSPSALAFAARMSAVQTKSDQAAAANPSSSPAVAGSQTSVEIPMRYAATAQIIQSAALGTQQEGPKKDAGGSSDGFARPDAKTDLVLPQFETVSQAAANPGSPAPQQTAPPPSAESVIEPPAAPPTSSHDIRVQVPDNNGGSTQVRFVESGGEVRVSVRTADDGLAQNLRTHLNDLTQRLSDGGTPAEIWKPASSATSSQNDSQQPQQQDGRGSGGQGSGGQNGQQDRQQKRPAWLDEMEASLDGEQN